MISSKGGRAAQKKRSKLKKEFWPDDVAWEGPDETGYFCAPRTLLYVFNVLRLKTVSGNTDPNSAYLELLSRHMGEGIIEMAHEEDHADAAGYSGPRGIRSWRERMRLLEERGFIKSKEKGSRRYGYVLLVHPSAAMQKLKDQNLIPENIWNAYRARQIDGKERSYEELIEEE